MSVTLSENDLTRLVAAVSTLLAPLDFPTITDWRHASRLAVQALVEADKSIFMFPLEGEPLNVCEPEDAEGVAAYEAYFHKLDTGLHVRRRERGLEVFNWCEIYDLRELPKTEIYNDFSRRYGLLDATTATVDMGPGVPPAGVFVYHSKATGREFGDRGVALLRLLEPALEAGVESCRRVAQRRSDLARIIDQLDDGVLIARASGEVLHQTPALARMLAADPERERLREELKRVAVTLGALSRRGVGKTHAGVLGQPASRDVWTVRGTYRICGSFLSSGLVGTDPVVLVFLVPRRREPFTDQDLCTRFRLTAREAQVAQLAASGHTAAVIARELGISTHTARHHLEQVRAKMGKRRIGEVAAAIRVGNE